MWLYTSGNDGLPPIRLYDYWPGRSGDYAVEFLGDFSGYLTCDGYTGYNKLVNVTRCGCLAHMRHYWHEAIPAALRKKKPKNQPALPAETGRKYCNHLFELEKQYMELDPDKRKQLRLQTQAPIWKSYWKWLYYYPAAPIYYVYDTLSEIKSVMDQQYVNKVNLQIA